MSNNWLSDIEAALRQKEGKAQPDRWYEWFLQHLVKEKKVRVRLGLEPLPNSNVR